MSDKFKRRRRRSGSTSARFRPPELVSPDTQGPKSFGKLEIAASVAVGIVALALVALIWIVTSRTVQQQRVEIRERAERALSAQASTTAEMVAHELLMIDQSLTIIQQAWKSDSASVDLQKWREKMPGLLAVADDLFIADSQHIIRQDILPKAVGQGVGSAYVTFPHGSLEQFQADGTKDKDSLIQQGDPSAPIDARQFLMYVVRPLDHPLGWLVGASYRSDELTKLFAGASLGLDPVVALVDTSRGVLQAVVGPASRRPRTDLSKSVLFDVMTRTSSGIWLGATPIDGVERLHAYHRVPGRNMAVIVGESWKEVMRPADSLAAAATSLAIVGSALVLVIGGVVLWGVFTLRVNRRQKQVFARNRSELERLRSNEGVLASKAQLNAARLQAILDSTMDGVALLDSSFHLVQWNHPFRRGIGFQPSVGMSLEAMLREQAVHEMFPADDDLDAEIARRRDALKAGDKAGLLHSGPDGERLYLRGLPVNEGGFMLLLNGLTSWEPAPAGSASPEVDEPVGAEQVVAPIQW